MILYWSSIIAWVVCVVGCGYLVGATILTDRLACKASPARRASMPGVTILKPLHGTEPGLLENLASFCAQNYPGPVQIVLPRMPRACDRAWRRHRLVGMPARAALAGRTSFRSAAASLVPLRDLLSFAIFVSCFFGRSARWKGRRYRFVSGGTLVVAEGLSR
jgi:hypothetical protein